MRKVFIAMLSIGNIMNGGNGMRGQADGFNLESYSKFTSIKDINGQTAFMYICKLLKE
jgi:formin 2